MSNPPPGPWSHRPTFPMWPYDTSIVDANGNTMAQCDHQAGPLLAAAPDMLELLREAHTALNWQGAEYLAARVQSVIAKATA